MKSSKATVVGIVGFARLLYGLFYFCFFCATSPTLMAQDSQKPAPASTLPGAATTHLQDAQAAAREAWRKEITRVRFQKPGCFSASYPSTEWKEVPCSSKPPPLQLPPGQGAGRVIPENVGDGGSNDWAAGVSGLISTAVGEIMSVTSGTTETDSLSTESDQFSLQLNSQHNYTTPLCNGGNTGCYGWQQFGFLNQGPPGLSSQALAFIQYWLVNWGTTTCPGQAPWQQQGSDCVINVPSNPTTYGAISASSLAGVTLTAHAGQGAGDLDSVMVVTPNGNAQATATANYLNLAQYWSAAEFNVFGYGNASTANFNPGTTIVVKTSVTVPGVMNPPLCVPESFTGEQNNLNLANTTGSSTLVCCPYSGGSPNIQFIETNAGETGKCGSTQIVGDTHITTANGVRYDFQSAGEFVSLRDSNGDEIQTRQAPVSTTFIGTDAYDALTTCVSLNTAVAARVGEHRVTYQPNLSGVPDPSGLQLRIDGVPTALGLYGRDLGNGSRVFKSARGGDLEIDFPDGKTLFVTPTWWVSQSKWYLNVVVTHLGLVSSPDGIAGPIANGSWLPALPSGASLGPMPGPLDDRYATLYSKFADAWRVTDKNSLFDYAPGTSTETFTMRDWPPQKAPCIVPETRPVEPASEAVAEQACRRIWDKNMHADCVFDVRATGNTGFAQTYLDTQHTLADSTTLSLTDDVDPSQVGEWVTFTAYVASNATTVMGFPSGTVQFTVDGSNVGEPVKVDAKGRAMWQTSQLKVGEHQVAASYVPGADTMFLPSASVEKIHVVRRCPCDAAHEH
jgi:hypothetical protein